MSVFPIYISPKVVAMSIAGVSFENCTYARFSIFVVMNVFTFVTFALKRVSIAFLMSGFVAFRSTTNMSLFSDSMSRNDFSVDNGCFIVVLVSILHE